jgi:hypothetical protein
MSMGGGQMQAPQAKAPSKGASTKYLLFCIAGLAVLVIVLLVVLLLKK